MKFWRKQSESKSMASELPSRKDRRGQIKIRRGVQRKERWALAWLC